MDKTPKNKTNDTEIEDKEVKKDAKEKALEKVRQKAVILDIEDLADKEARKAADARMTESKDSLKGFSGMIKKIWKHTFFDEYYRQKEVSRVRSEIAEKDNIYVGRDIEKNAHDEAMSFISKRFTSEYDETLSEGEQRDILDSKNNDDRKAISDIKNLITEYAKGNFSEESFQNEKVRILDEIDEAKNGKSKGHHLYSDNLFEIAQNARIAIEHGVKMEELQLDSNIILGKAKSSLKTEAHFNKVDSVIDKMKKSKVGRFVNPATLNTALGLAYSVSVGVGSRFLRSKVSGVATFGAGVAISGVLTGMNESQRLKLERAQHGVEVAEDGEFEDGSKRREQMDKFTYEMKSSNDLASNLRDLMFEKDKDGKDVLKNIKKEDVGKIMATLADIEARNSLNSKNKIDLISYSKIDNVEKERTDLTILTARAKVELRKKLEGELKNGLPKDEKDFDSYFAKQVEVVECTLKGGEKGIDAQDKAFSKFKNKEVAKKVAKTVTIGLIFGAVAQEVSGFASDRVANVAENLKGNLHGATALTPLASLSNWLSGQENLGEPTSHFVQSFKEDIVQARDYIDSHLDGVKDVVRDGWYDNDTPKPIFDHNELGIRWGGEADSAGIEDGNYVLDVSRMTSGGSFHDGLSVDAKEAIKNGDLKVIFSLTSGTQDKVFELPIGLDGKVIIDPDSEIGKLFFSSENGDAVFKGRFAEVVQDFGTKDGAMHVKTLATLVGEGNDQITDTVRSVTEVISQNHLDTDLPMYVPVMSRNPLESLKKDEKKIDNKQNSTNKILSKENNTEKVANKKDAEVANKAPASKSESKPDNTPKPEKKKDNAVIDNKKKDNVDTPEEKVFTKKDLSYIGTIFETDKYTYKVTNIKSLGWFGTRKVITVIVTSKEDPTRQELLSYSKKSLIEQLDKKLINITKSGKVE